MKDFLRSIVVWFLRQKAKKVLNSKAQIIAVTGSMGKTTAKDAIAHVLKNRHQVLVSPEGFNTEIGILLTLLGEESSGFSSLRKWMSILLRALFRSRKIPEVIILEFGVDRPGDMDRLIKIVRPHCAVITNIAPVHLGPGQFASTAEIATEKMKLPQALPADGTAVLNFDLPLIREHSDKVAARILRYGSGSDNEYCIREVAQQEGGSAFTVEVFGKRQEFFVPFLGTYHTAVLLPAIILGREFGLELSEIAARLQTFFPAAGRGRIFAGRNDSVIWDSSYNSAPEAAKAALRTLRQIPALRRLALLGNMNELGEASGKFHEELGKVAAECADELYFVGKESAYFEAGVNGQRPVRFFPNAEAAGDFLQTILRSGDILLVKGSQNGVFLERAVKTLLKNPEDVKLLCRQGKEWAKK